MPAPALPVGQGGACFPRAREPGGALGPLRLRLTDAHAGALADLTPLMLCGEESAILAFDRLADHAPESPEAQIALRRVADEEGAHERLLAQLTAALPAPLAPPPADTVRRFFRTMADRDRGRHFLKIAALDSGLCAILSEMRARTAATARERSVERMFARIHADEARHVATAVGFARRLRPLADLAETVIGVRDRLADLLERQAASLETLHVSPERVLGRLRRAPAWLAR